MLQTYEYVRVLLQPNGGEEIRAFLSVPGGYDCLWEPVGAAAVTVRGGCVLVGVRVGLGGRWLGVGGIDWGAVVDIPLVFVIGVRLGICRSRIEVHGHVAVQPSQHRVSQGWAVRYWIDSGPGKVSDRARRALSRPQSR